MVKMITANAARPVGILVSALFLQQIVLTLNMLFVSSSTLQSEGLRCFDIFFLFQKRNIIFIDSLKQSKSSEQNSTKPEVLVILSKGQRLGSQLEVRVNA